MVKTLWWGNILSFYNSPYYHNSQSISIEIKFFPNLCISYFNYSTAIIVHALISTFRIVENKKVKIFFFPIIKLSKFKVDFFFLIKSLNKILFLYNFYFIFRIFLL